MLCLYIRAFVPESPHWLLRKGRVEEARKSLAWALQMDPEDIPLPAVLPPVEKTRWIELFKYPRSIIAGCLTGLTQTGGVALSLWMVTLFVMVLKITPPEASKLVIWSACRRSPAGFSARGYRTRWGAGPRASSPAWSRRSSWRLAGYYNSAFVGGISVFFLLIVAQSFLGSGNYSIVGPYMGELWPARLRGSGMGLVYGVGNLGKFIGPLGLALIAGSSNYVKPAATLEALIPGFLYFSYWYLLGAFAFWFIGTETRGRSIDDIDAEMSGMQARGPQIVTAVCGILAGAVSVAVQPFLPIAVFIGVGITILSPSIGGALLVAVAAGIVAYFGGGMVTAVIGLGTAGAMEVGIIGLLGVLTVILTLVAGVASLITAFGKSAASPEPAKFAAE